MQCVCHRPTENMLLHQLNSPMKDVPTTTTCLPAAASATALASSGALITCTPGRPPPGIPSFRGLQINRSDQTCMDAEIYFTTIIENMHLPGQGTSQLQVTLICIALASIKYRINKIGIWSLKCWIIQTGRSDEMTPNKGNYPTKI